MQKITLLIVALITGPFWSTLAFADTLMVSGDVAPIFEMMSKSEQEALLKEGKEAQRSCESHSIFGAQHDCKCIAERFLTLRLTTAKNQSKGNILSDIKYECPNPSGMVALHVRQCKDINYNGDPVKVEAQCTCVGEKTAEEMVYMMQNGGKLFRHKFNYEQECVTGKTAKRPADWPTVTTADAQ